MTKLRPIMELFRVILWFYRMNKISKIQVSTKEIISEKITIKIIDVAFFAHGLSVIS